MSDEHRTPNEDPGAGRREQPDLGELSDPYELARAAPGLTRIALTAGWHGAAWAAGAYANAASRLVRAASRGESATQVMRQSGSDLRGYARELLGIANGATGEGAASKSAAASERSRNGSSPEALRKRGTELLRRSAEIGPEDASHPSYMRILESLAPDEARVLRFLAQHGAQPSVDIRAGLPLVSELVAPGCNMIGAESGCRHPDRVRVYLDNVHRLGLIWFSREPVKDPSRYQVLEAQPEVIDALEHGGRATRTVRRSIMLTPFGEDFCAVCLPLEDAAPGASDAGAAD